MKSPDLQIINTERRKKTEVVQEKVQQLEKLVALYADAENGFSRLMLGIKIAKSNPESLESNEGQEAIENLKQNISNFLIEFSKFSEADKKNFGFTLQMQIGKILEAIKQKDWELFSKAAQVLDAYFEGMETVLSVINSSVIKEK